ncbi:MAG: hypothetical protein M3Q08_05285 [Pseudomonadota bacterium]|nr:hypothetical protein [Pseudomonadota bacterium]
MYAFPILIVAMLGYMFWLATFNMRRDRVLRERSHRSPSIPLQARPRARPLKPALRWKL